MNMKILYVCTGNICRSPLGEGITRHLAKEQGLQVVTASAGTHGYHIGEPPDPRSVEVARQRGISLRGQTARKLKISDFREFDLILAMDAGHLDHLKQLCPPDATAELALFMTQAEGLRTDVPDPYYGDMKDFEQVFDMVEAGVRKILSKV